MTSSDNYQFVFSKNWRMKSSCCRFSLTQRYLNFMPFFSFQIKQPDVIKICEIFASKCYKILSNYFWNMICSFPRSNLISYRFNSRPLFGGAIERIEWIKALFSLSSPCKEYECIIMMIVVKGCVRSGFRNVACCRFIFPLKSEWTKGPEVIHVIWIYVIVGITCITTENNQIVCDDTTTMAPSFGWFRWIKGLYFEPVQFFHVIGNNKVFLYFFRVYFCVLECKNWKQFLVKLHIKQQI